MKKIIYLSIFLFYNFSISQSNITFNVDPSSYSGFTAGESIVYLVGDFNGWNPGDETLQLSDDDGDGIHSITIPLEDGDYTYKYTLGGWDTQEFWSCEKECLERNDGGYWNRTLTVAGEDQVLDFVHWNMCAGEEPLDPDSTITINFEVNAAHVTVATTIYAGGGFLGDAMAVPLSDDDGDGVYTGSTVVPEGSGGNYIYLNSPTDGSNWDAKEQLNGQECADPLNWNDRLSECLFEDTTFSACFGYCSGNATTGDCLNDVQTYSLTMSVNTASIVVGENGIYLGGGVFNSATAHALSDDDNDGVWQVTVEVPEGFSGNYIFLNSPNHGGDYSNKENLEGQDCADPENWNDRILAPVYSDTTILHCFGSCETDGSCGDIGPSLSLKGILDFNVPSGPFDGRGIHLIVNQNIDDLSHYGIGIANNGGGTDNQEYTFPAVSTTVGQHILVARSIEAMDNYMNASEIFDHIFLDESNVINGGGDDAVELFYLDEVIDTFGDVNMSGLGQEWEYTDSWAFYSDGNWIYGGVNCTDSSTTTCESSCVYPFAYCGDSFNLYSENGLRLYYEEVGYRAVSPGDAIGASGAWFWQAEAYNDFLDVYNTNNPNYPNQNNVNNGLVDDIMFFYEDGTFTYDTGDDGTIMGKKDEVDAAFDPSGEYAYDADNDVNEYHNYPLDDFSDTFILGNDGTYNTIEFETIGALGLYTSTGAQVYQILEQTANTIYVRNVGSEGNAWYSLLTTDPHSLSNTQINELDMIIFPNPVDGNYVTVLSPVNGIKEIQIYNLTGMVVSETIINNNIIDVSLLQSGLYFIKISINGQTKVSKLIIK